MRKLSSALGYTIGLGLILAVAAPASYAELQAGSLAAMESSSLAETNNDSQPTLQNSNLASGAFSTNAATEYSTAASFSAQGPLNMGWDLLRNPRLFIRPRPDGWGSTGQIWPSTTNGMSNGWGTNTGSYATAGAGPGPAPFRRTTTPHIRIYEPHRYGTRVASAVVLSESAVKHVRSVDHHQFAMKRVIWSGARPLPM